MNSLSVFFLLICLKTSEEEEMVIVTFVLKIVVLIFIVENKEWNSVWKIFRFKYQWKNKTEMNKWEYYEKVSDSLKHVLIIEPAAGIQDFI